MQRMVIIEHLYNMKIKTIFWPLLTSLLVLSFFSCNESAPEQPKKIPQVDFSEIEKILAIKDDTLRVINFWATWCKPCVEELPLLEQLAEQNKNKAFSLYYISLDFPNQIESKLIPFLKENPLNGEVIVLDDPDANTWIDKVNPNWSGAIPATIINSGGNHNFHEGQLNSFEDIQHLISNLSSDQS